MEIEKTNNCRNTRILKLYDPLVKKIKTYACEKSLIEIDNVDSTDIKIQSPEFEVISIKLDIDTSTIYIYNKISKISFRRTVYKEQPLIRIHTFYIYFKLFKNRSENEEDKELDRFISNIILSTTKSTKRVLKFLESPEMEFTLNLSISKAISPLMNIGSKYGSKNNKKVKKNKIGKDDRSNSSSTSSGYEESPPKYSSSNNPVEGVRKVDENSDKKSNKSLNMEYQKALNIIENIESDNKNESLIKISNEETNSFKTKILTSDEVEEKPSGSIVDVLDESVSAKNDLESEKSNSPKSKANLVEDKFNSVLNDKKDNPIIMGNQVLVEEVKNKTSSVEKKNKQKEKTGKIKDKQGRIRDNSGIFRDKFGKIRSKASVMAEFGSIPFLPNEVNRFTTNNRKNIIIDDEFSEAKETTDKTTNPIPVVVDDEINNIKRAKITENVSEDQKKKEEPAPRVVVEDIPKESSIENKNQEKVIPKKPVKRNPIENLKRKNKTPQSEKEEKTVKKLKKESLSPVEEEKSPRKTPNEDKLTLDQHLLNIRMKNPKFVDPRTPYEYEKKKVEDLSPHQRAAVTRRKNRLKNFLEMNENDTKF